MYDVEVDLDMSSPAPDAEAWSVTVDKKVCIITPVKCPLHFESFDEKKIVDCEIGWLKCHRDMGRYPLSAVQLLPDGLACPHRKTSFCR